MEIVLEYLSPENWPRPKGWTVVGRVGTLALAFDPARQPFLIGDGEPHPLDPVEVNAALAPAVDAAADRLWPGGWMPSFAEAFAVDKRSLSASRLARQGLPPAVLFALAHTSYSHAPTALGALLLALARYTDQVSAGSHFDEQIEETMHEARNASEILRYARRGKPVFPERQKGLVKE
ncbi:hypothetical protein [Methylobacterium platani]|uniref:Uncharacterized protein n=1 Tax=Methylobacterium platani TaxID=427683 RepID=A0A179S5Q0_9HYPH|nr:hypothetical protein [Methylobacterium platani]OAS22525.1 hypothetical protein A5481_19215 [Methylobacterium platani]